MKGTIIIYFTVHAVGKYVTDFVSCFASFAFLCYVPPSSSFSSTMCPICPSCVSLSLKISRLHHHLPGCLAWGSLPQPHRICIILHSWLKCNKLHTLNISIYGIYHHIGLASMLTRPFYYMNLLLRKSTQSSHTEFYNLHIPTKVSTMQGDNWLCRS